MFGSKKQEKRIGKIETVIGHESVINGTVSTKSSLKVDGIINGGIEQADSVIIGETGKVKGDITAQSVLVSGEVEGNIHSFLSVDLLEDAKVIGDVKTAQISISEGAFFQGNVQMEKSHYQTEENTD